MNCARRVPNVVVAPEAQAALAAMINNSPEAARDKEVEVAVGSARTAGPAVDKAVRVVGEVLRRVVAPETAVRKGGHIHHRRS